jgi:hypothetical protein
MLNHLELNFEDEELGYMIVMLPELRDALTSLTKLLSFQMWGCVVWSGSGWKNFARSNPLLRGAALTIWEHGQGVRVGLLHPSLNYH